MMTARDEWHEMVKVNIRKSVSYPRLRKPLKMAVHQAVYDITKVPLREIMEIQYKDRDRRRARWLLTWGLYEILQMSNEGLARYTGMDMSTVRHMIKNAPTKFPQECRDLQQRCNP